MTPAEISFLQIFREINTSRNSIVMPQVIMGHVNKWPEDMRDEAGDAFNRLAARDFVKYENDKYWLLDGGFDYLYADHDVDQTKQLVLGCFTKNHLEQGHLLPHGVLNATREKWDAWHREKLPQVLVILADEGFIQYEQQGYRRLK